MVCDLYSATTWTPKLRPVRMFLAVDKQPSVIKARVHHNQLLDSFVSQVALPAFRVVVTDGSRQVQLRRLALNKSKHGTD